MEKWCTKSDRHWRPLVRNVQMLNSGFKEVTFSAGEISANFKPFIVSLLETR